MTTEVLAFYKGTPFPRNITVNPSDWKELTESWDQCIVNGLKVGFDIKNQIKAYFDQLNRIELFFNKFHKEIKTNKMTKKLGKKLEQDIQQEFNKNIDTIQSIWYMDIYMLMKMKQLENNDDNGWVFMGKDNTIIM